MEEERIMNHSDPEEETFIPGQLSLPMAKSSRLVLDKGSPLGFSIQSVAKFTSSLSIT